MTAWQAAIEVLRETDNPAVIAGDAGLCHAIATKLGWEHDAWETEKRVLAALSKTPGDLVVFLCSVRRGSRIYNANIFVLPERRGEFEDDLIERERTV